MGGCQCGGFRRRVEIFSAGKNTTRHLTAHKPQRTQYASLFSGKKKNLPLALPVVYALTKRGTDHLPTNPLPYQPDTHCRIKRCLRLIKPLRGRCGTA